MSFCRRTIVLATLLAAPFCLVVVLSMIGAALSGPTRSPGSTTPASRPGTIPAVWTLSPAQLRPDLPDANVIGSLDGSFVEGHVAEVAGRWLVETGTAEAEDVEVHAIDPDDGTVRWHRPLDGGLCATEAPEAGILCASVLQRDPATGLGTRWRLHVIDPATGEDKTTRDVDAWFSAVHWTGSTFVGLEQREPAPHAVLRGFGTDLRERWSRDLQTEAGQAEMFSEDRIILRHEPDRPGVVLDRPRLRDVGSGLVALWAGGRTAFVNAASGKLMMMPHCSRLVDDGKRLWCNEVDGASAYGYDGTPLVRVRGPRLAFPDDDGIGVDRNRPVFLDDDGAGVTVDPTTGKVGEAYTPPGRGSAFGLVTMPSTETAAGKTFLVGEAGAMLLDPDADRVLLRNPDITISDVPIVQGGQVLLGSGSLSSVDLATGTSTGELRSDALYVVAVGGQVAGIDPGISLLKP